MAAARTRSLAVASSFTAVLLAAVFWLAPLDPAPLAPSALVVAHSDAAPAPIPAANDAGAGRTAAAAARGCWTAPIGTRFRHTLVDRCDVALASAQGGSQSAGALHATCDVLTVVLDRRDGETLVQHQLEGLAFLGADGRPLAGDALQASFVAAAAAPLHVRIDPVGHVLGIGFGDGLDGDQRNFLRGTLGLLACEAPGAAAPTTWTSEGHDTTGTFAARLELLPANGADELLVRRTRTHYTRIVGQSELPEHELRGGATVRFALDRGWLADVDLDETLVLQLPLLDLRATTHRRATARLVAVDTVGTLGDVAAAWAGATSGATSDGERLGAHAGDQERRLWRERLQGTSVDALLAEIRQLLAAQPVDHQALDGAFQQLQWLLRLDDGAVAALQQQLAAGQLAEDVAHVAVGSLGAAGTAAAQGALAGLRGDASQPVALRSAATVACLQLAEPAPALLDALAAEALADGGDAALRGSSLLVLGALAPRAAQPLADGRTPLQALLALEPEAARRGELDTWVMAVANAGAPDTLAIALRLLDDERAAVRGACCVALRGLPAETALRALVERGLGDADPQVRHEAVLALSRRSEPAARTALTTAAAQDPDLGVRERATRLLQRGA